MLSYTINVAWQLTLMLCARDGSDGNLLMERVWKGCPYHRTRLECFRGSLTPRPQLENSEGQTRTLSGDAASQKTWHDMGES